jgi:RyR domain/TrkA-N domain
VLACGSADGGRSLRSAVGADGYDESTSWFEGRPVDPTQPTRFSTGRSRSARRQIHYVWRRWRWRIIAAIGVCAFVLGLIGYGHVYVHLGDLYPAPTASHLPPVNWIDRLYYTILLFKFSTAVGPPYSAPLEFARWIAPLVTAYAGFRVIADLFSDRWGRFRSNRLLSGHVVVCGLGRCGLRIATADWGRPVVAIEQTPSSTDVERCRELGIILLTGDATDWLVLGQAGLDRASCMFVVCGDDGTNAEVGLLARDRVKHRHPPLGCFVAVYDEGVCDLLEKASIADPTRRSINFEFFNIYRSGPRTLLDTHGAVLSGVEPPQVIVVGYSRFAMSLLVESARRWSVQDGTGGPLRCVVVAPDAARVCEDLSQHYPDLVRVCDLVARPGDASDPDSDSLGLDDVATFAAPSTAFVCLDDDAAGLRATIRLREILSERSAVVLCTTGHSDMARLLRLAGSDGPLNVNGFGLLDQVCRPEVLLNGDRERIAQAMHGAYVRAESLEGRSSDDVSMRPWDTLPESLRESNRDQAADIGRKLKAVGLDLVLTSSWGPPSFSFNPEDLDQLAEEEHQRWVSKLLADGWTFGEQKDVERKVHPLLVPWEKLSCEEREKDFNAVRVLPSLLAFAGYAIVSKKPASAEARPAD